MATEEQTGGGVAGEMPMMSAEQLAKELAFDTTRVWANNVQVFRNPEHTLLVFREMVEVEAQMPNGTTHKVPMTKNVGSLIVSTETAKSLADVLTRLFAENAKSAD